MYSKFLVGVPVYKQLADRIRQRIESGEFAPGEQLPPEHTLSKLCHVSRVTVRKAIEIIENEGLVVRLQGKGTYVAVDNFIESPDAKGSFTLSCIQRGVVPTTKIILFEETRASEELSAELGCGEDENIIRIVRVRCANDVPVIYETDYLPADSHSYLLGKDLTDMSLMDEIKKCSGLSFGPYEDMIDVGYAKEAHADVLKVKKGSALLRVHQKVFDTEGNIIYINEQLINSERYKYVSVHSK